MIRNNSTSGFSLLEMIVTISLIGILVGLLIPKFASISDIAQSTTAKRNAQNVGGVSISLAGLGVEHVIPESLGGREATCRLIRHGITIPDGPMAGSFFGLPSLAEEEISSTAAYLEVIIDGFNTLRVEYKANPAAK